MFYIFLAITLLFIANLVIKNFLKKPFCSLCVAVASTWLILLIFYKTNHFSDQVLLGLLVGQSITGIFYLAYRRMPKTLRIFSLPFVLSLTALLYMLITSEIQLPTLGLLVILWIVSWIVFTYRDDPGKKNIAKVFAKCCEDE